MIEEFDSLDEFYNKSDVNLIGEVFYVGISCRYSGKGKWKNVNKIENTVMKKYPKLTSGEVKELTKGVVPFDGPWSKDSFFESILTVPFTSKKQADKFVTDLLEEANVQGLGEVYIYYVDKETLDLLLLEEYDLSKDNNDKFVILNNKKLISLPIGSIVYACYNKDDDPENVRLFYSPCKLLNKKKIEKTWELQFDDGLFVNVEPSQAIGNSLSGRGQIYFYKKG